MIEATTTAYLGLREQPLWKLLAAQTGPVVLALLESHLLEKDRTLTNSVMTERIAEDLRRLRLAGAAVPVETPAKLLMQWVNAGYLLRRLPEGAAEEEFELSLDAANAIRFVRNLRRPRSAVTESRLNVVTGQVVALAAATQAVPEARLEALRRERAKIDAEIADVEAGRWQSMSPERALERLREVLGLADDLMTDFRRVRNEFDRLHRSLREQIMESDATRGDVLEGMFSGYDAIAASEAGQSFQSFYQLLTDHEQSTKLDASIDELLQREFAGLLEVKERKMLRGLTASLLDQAVSVHEVMHYFARSLRDFVRSSEFRELKRLNSLIKDAERTALVLKDQIRPHAQVGKSLELTSAIIKSVTELKLLDLDDTLAPAGMEIVPEGGDIEDVAHLLQHGDIDFAAIKQDIAAALGASPNASVGDVLRLRPARQGFGTVMGLLLMADKFGVASTGSEHVEWVGIDGERRAADIPVFYFTRESLDEIV